MKRLEDKRALTQWNKSAISYKNYRDFIDKKSERFKISLIDLLYISNFKGGNATINEPESIIENKLVGYGKLLIEINEVFNNKAIAKLNSAKIDNLIIQITSICNLTHKGTSTKIDGFSVSYLSALLNSYFPDLIPILDRRILINLGIVKSDDTDKNGQIKNIQRHYGPLVKKVSTLCKKKQISVRELDKILFTTKLKIP